MDVDDPDPSEDLLAEALAAYHEGLAAGRMRPVDPDGIPAELRHRYEETCAFLNFLEEAWPRDVATSSSDPSELGPSPDEGEATSRIAGLESMTAPFDEFTSLHLDMDGDDG